MKFCRLTLVFTFCLIVLSLNSHAQELIYPWMDPPDSPLMSQWLRKQSSLTLNSLNQKEALWREVRTDLNEWMREQGPVILKTIPLGPLEELVVVDEGLGRPVRVQHLKGKKVVKTFYETPKNDPYSVSALDVDLSPSGRWVLVPVSTSGSIDQHTIHIFDFESGKLLWKLDHFSSHWVWRSQNEFSAVLVLEDPVQLVVVDLSNIQNGKPLIRPHDEPDHAIGSDPTRKYHLRWRGEPREMSLIETLTQEKRSLGDQIFVKVWWAAENGALLQNESQLFLADFKSEPKAIQSEMNRYEAVHPLEDGFLIYGFKGFRARIERVSRVGKVLSAVDLPIGVSLRKFHTHEANGFITVELQSHVVESHKVDLSLGDLKIDEESIANSLHWDGRLQWSTQVIFGESKDGTKVPALVTHREDLPLDGRAPALIEVYGGFGRSMTNAHFQGLTKKMFLDHRGFLKGGVYVSAALRGGGEFGPEWRRQATGLNKIKTFEDLIAVTEQLHKLKITSPQLTALIGQSNGGLTVSATAFLRPDLFSVVVPINGVLDLMNKDTLDKRFSGWSYEYGSPSESQEMWQFLKEMSPVHNLGKNAPPPKHIVVNGQSDGRVNPIHSFTLIEALQQNFKESQSVLVTVKHGGHWVNHLAYQDVHAFRVSSRLWTELIDEVSGHTFD